MAKVSLNKRLADLESGLKRLEEFDKNMVGAFNAIIEAINKKFNYLEFRGLFGKLRLAYLKLKARFNKSNEEKK